MKKFICLSALLLTFTLFNVSCSSNEDRDSLSSQSQQTIEDMLVSKISSVFDNKQYGDSADVYIVYFANDNTMDVLTENEYVFAHSLAILIENGSSDTATDKQAAKSEAPKDNDWTLGGSGKSKRDAIALAYKIAKKIPQNTDFEIHVEYAKDGSFKLWYRAIEKEE